MQLDFKVIDMILTVPHGLPAKTLLANEGFHNISDGDPEAASLRILVVNLMPKKMETETDLLRMLSVSPLSLDIIFALPDGHSPKNTPPEHIQKFYITLDTAMRERWDGMIVTGAPLDFVEYEDVHYWSQICTLMEWSRKNVRSTMWVCWGAFAALYYRYGINKHTLGRKTSGVFPHVLIHPEHPLMDGMDPDIQVPHSRHVAVSVQEIIIQPELSVLAYSSEAGAYLLAEHSSRDVMVFGHPEYNAMTLHNEYTRDLGKGMNPHIPDHYYPENDIMQKPHNRWSEHAHKLYRNWITRLVNPQ